jgi:hypothetical protein
MVKSVLFLLCVAGFFLSGCATTGNRSALDVEPWYADANPMDESSDWDIIDISPTMFRESKDTADDLRFEVTELFR